MDHLFSTILTAQQSKHTCPLLTSFHPSPNAILLRPLFNLYNFQYVSFSLCNFNEITFQPISIKDLTPYVQFSQLYSISNRIKMDGNIFVLLITKLWLLRIKCNIYILNKQSYGAGVWESLKILLLLKATENILINFQPTVWLKLFCCFDLLSPM